MKFTTTTLLLSAAIAAVASAAPTISANAHIADRPGRIANISLNFLHKRCAECNQDDSSALNLIIKASANHYSEIAHARLDALMNEIADAKVTSGNKDLPQEKALLSITVKTNIDLAKQDVSPEKLEPIIKATVEANSNMDVPWSKKEEIEQKMADLDVLITNVILDRIQAKINAELLSKDCTEKMTNTEIVPAPATPETAAPVAPAPENTAAPTPVAETPASPAPEAQQPVSPENAAAALPTETSEPCDTVIDPATGLTINANANVDTSKTNNNGNNNLNIDANVAVNNAPKVEDNNKNLNIDANVAVNNVPKVEDNNKGLNIDANVAINNAPKVENNNKGLNVDANVAINNAPKVEDNNKGLNVDANVAVNKPANTNAPKAGIDIAASVDSKYVCKSGCKDSEDAKTVLALRVNLENAFKPRLDHFYENEVAKDCTEKRASLLGSLLNLVGGLRVKADVKASK